MKMLRITGAPRSPHAPEYELPTRICGIEAYLAFHRIKPADGYLKYGKPLPVNKIESFIGSE